MNRMFPENIKENQVAEVRNVGVQQLDREYIGAIKKKKGQILFAMCVETFEVYEVKIRVVESKTAAIDFSTGKIKGEQKKEEYILKKGDPVLFALNMKNAVRKFQQLVNKKYR